MCGCGHCLEDLGSCVHWHALPLAIRAVVQLSSCVHTYVHILNHHIHTVSKVQASHHRYCEGLCTLVGTRYWSLIPGQIRTWHWRLTRLVPHKVHPLLLHMMAAHTNSGLEFLLIQASPEFRGVSWLEEQHQISLGET